MVIIFLAKKCRKCVTVASYEYYFIEQILWTTYHRKLIDPLLESRKFPTYCYYILQIAITTPLLIIAYLLQFRWKIIQKYSHVTSHWVKWLNFWKSKAKGHTCICLTFVKLWSCLHINCAHFVFLISHLQQKKKIHLPTTPPPLPKNFFMWVRGATFSQIV